MAAWVIWTIVAVAMIVAEVFISGFFVVWFGVGAIPAGIAAYFYPSNIVLQLGVYIIATIALLLSTRKVVKRLYQSGSKEKVGANRMLGKPGIVLEEIDSASGKGLVRVEHDQWRAESEGGSLIPKGKKIEVLRVEGTRLIVKVAEQDSPSEQGG